VKKGILIVGVLSIIGIMFLKMFGQKKENNSYDNKYKSIVRELSGYPWEDFESIKSMIQPAIEVISTKSSSIELGKSKIGGTPDLPKSINWPKYGTNSMVFFAQINLKDLSNYHRQELLPKSGILYFFSYFPEPENEFGAAYDFIRDKEEYKTIYFNGNIEELRKNEFPNDLISDYKFDSRKVDFRTFFHLPPSLETGIIESSSLSEKDKNLLKEYNDRDDYGIIDQVLGIPVPIQYGVDFDWAVAYLDIDYSEYKKRKGEINKLRTEFINLLTLPVFERIGYSQAYIGIHIDDLRKKELDKSVFVMQGT